MSHAHDQSHGGYEPRDAHAGPLVKFVVWLFIGTGLTLVAMYYLLEAYKLMPRFNAADVRHPLAAERQVPSEPRLEALKGIHQGTDGQVVDVHEQPYFNQKMWSDWNEQWHHQMTTYGYVDQAAGVVHVPIERAMELKLKQGFPVAKPKN